MPNRLPSFDLLWAGYPTGTADAVKALIGGNVNLPWITNTCAIRMSRALNAAGHPIPVGLPRLATTPGGDKARYSYRVAELSAYLGSTYGPAAVVKTSDQSAKSAIDAVAGRRGIIVFEVPLWTDATGHIDLWNGVSAREHAYFNEAKRVLFWETE